MYKTWTRNEVGRGAALAVVLGALLALCFPYFEAVRNANELPRLMQGMALVEDGRLALDSPSTAGIDVGPDVSRGPGGHLYPNKPPGASLLAAAAYVGARAGEGDLTLRSYTLWARLAGGLLPTLVLCGFAIRTYAPTLGARPVALATALYALATPAASYAHLFYGHQITACLLFVGVTWLGRAMAEGRPGQAALGGALAGAAVGVEYGAVFTGLPVAVALAVHLRQRGGLKTAGAAVGAAVVPVLLLAAYQAVAFGSPTSTGYHNVVDPTFAHKHGQGFLGLGLPGWDGFVTHVLSPRGGLLWWAPLFPLGLWGLLGVATQRDRDRTTARIMLAAFVLMLVVASSLSFEGGWRVGPRYLVAVLPFLIPGLALALSQIRTSPVWTGVVVALATYAVVVNGLAANLWPHLDLAAIRHPVPEVLLPLWDGGYQPYTPVAAWLPGAISAVSLVVAASLTVVGLLFVANADLGIRMWGGLAAGLVVGLVLVGGTRGWPAHPRGEANLRYIKAQWEPASVGGGKNRASRVLVRK